MMGRGDVFYYASDTEEIVAEPPVLPNDPVVAAGLIESVYAGPVPPYLALTYKVCVEDCTVLKDSDVLADALSM